MGLRQPCDVKIVKLKHQDEYMRENSVSIDKISRGES
jgi:hypothetical protein